jgi:hypothetical protein
VHALHLSRRHVVQMFLQKRSSELRRRISVWARASECERRSRSDRGHWNPYVSNADARLFQKRRIRLSHLCSMLEAVRYRAI